MTYNLTSVWIHERGYIDSRYMIAESVTKEDAEGILREMGHEYTRAKPLTVAKDDHAWPREYVDGWQYDYGRRQYHLLPVEVALFITRPERYIVIKGSNDPAETDREIIAEGVSPMEAEQAIREVEAANPELEERMRDRMPWLNRWRFNFGKYSYIVSIMKE